MLCVAIGVVAVVVGLVDIDAAAVITHSTVPPTVGNTLPSL